MIKFFRRIRQQLLTENKFNKYLLYASGEIVLVVIGILIALQINNWNEQRKDNIREEQLKSVLYDEFEKDLAQLESKIKIRNRLIQSALKLHHLIDQGASADVDSIIHYMAFSSYRPTFDPITVELIDKNDLGLIKNDQLRRLLTSWKVDVTQLREDELNWRDYVTTYRYANEINSEAGFNRNLQIEFWKNNGSNLFLLDNDSISYVEITPPDHKINYHKLLQVPFWDNYCTRAIQLNQDANLNSFALKKRILEILELLKRGDD